jgi:hypothetical protein
MKQCDFPVRSAIPQMRPFPEEYNSNKACNDADPCPTVRQRVHRISLAVPCDAQAGAEGQTGLSRVFNLILWVLYTGKQWKCLPVPTDPTGKPAIHYTVVF